MTLGGSHGATVQGSVLTVGGSISGNGLGITKAGSGDLNLTGAIDSTVGSVAVNAGTLQLGGNNSYTGGTRLDAGATLDINNASALGTGTLTINGGTIDNTSGGAVTLTGNNLMDWNGDFTFTGTSSLNLGTGSVVLGGSRTVTVSANTLTVGGNISGATFGIVKAGAGTLIFNGVVGTGAGTITVSGGTLVLNGANTYTGITTVNSGTLQAGNTTALGTGPLTINGGTFDANGHNVTITGLVTINGGIYLASTGTQTLNGGLTISGGTFSGSSGTVNTTDMTLSSGALTLTNGLFNVSGNWLQSGGTFTAGSSTVTFNATSTGHTITSDGSSFNNVTFNGVGGSWFLQDPFITTGNLTITNGTLNANGQAMTIGGNWSNSGSFIASSNTVTFDGTTVISGSSTNTFNNIVIAAASTLTAPAGNMNVTGNWTNSGTFNANGGTVTFEGTSTIGGSQATSFNNIIIAPASTLTAPAGNMNVGGNWTNSGTFNANGGTVTFNGTTAIGGSSIDTFNNVTITGSLTAPAGNMNVGGNWTNSGTFNANGGTVTFISSGTQTLNSGGNVFYNITHSGSGTLELVTGPLTVTHDFNNAAGAFDLNGQDWTMTGAAFTNPATIELSGSETITGLTQDTTEGTWSYIGDNTGSTYTIKNYTYHDLMINDTNTFGDTFNLPGTINVVDLSILSGTLASNNFNIFISGNWNNTGSFVAGTDTVTFDGGDQSILGSTTFNNLTKIALLPYTLTFQAGQTQTITGTLTLTGFQVQLLSLRSSSPGTQWEINPLGNRVMTQVNVQDGNNINAQTIICVGVCIDAGNNTGFFGLYIPVPPDFTLANVAINAFSIPGNAFLLYDYLYNTSWEDDTFYSYDDAWELIRKFKRQDALLKKTRILYAKKVVTGTGSHETGSPKPSFYVKLLPVTTLAGFPGTDNAAINLLPLTNAYPLQN